MKDFLFIFIVLLSSCICMSQNADVEGELKVDSIDMNLGLIKNVSDPVAAQDVATKAYVDALESQVIILQGLKDIDNNRYNTISIGNQLWMAENLSVTRYNDGTVIPQVVNDSDWFTATSNGEACYTWYENGASDYGALYSYFAVADTNSLNICPVGWHVPSNDEWTILTTFLGGPSATGGKLKEAGLAHWNPPNTGAINESGFTGLPGGFRLNTGTFNGIGNDCRWWSSTEGSSGNSAWFRNLLYNNESILLGLAGKASGLSVRCLKD